MSTQDRRRAGERESSPTGRGVRWWVADWGRMLIMLVALCAAQLGLVQLVGRVVDVRSDFFALPTAGVITAVALVGLWLCARSLGRAGIERLDRRMGDHRTPQLLYGPDAAPVGHGLSELSCAPVLLVAPVLTALSTTDRVTHMVVVLPFIVAAVVPFAAGYLGRTTGTLVSTLGWFLVAGAWYALPGPVPELLGLVLALAGLGGLAWWCARRKRSRLPDPAPVGLATSRNDPSSDPDRQVTRVADFEVDYDEGRWLLLPGPGEEGGSPRHGPWAQRTARARWSRPAGWSETRSADDLADALTRMAETLPRAHTSGDDVAEVILLHHPVGHDLPVPVYIHVLTAETTIAAPEAIRRLVRADDPDALVPPVLDEVTSRSLGQGLRSITHFPFGDDGGVYAVLSYAWRVEAAGVDVRVWCSTPDLGRLTLVVEDADEIVNGVRIVDPDPACVSRP